MSAPHPVRYTHTARILHWLIAVMIVAATVIAIISGDLPLTPHKIHLINYHKWAGLTVLWLLIAQIGWRLAHPPPDLPATLTAWERNTALATHWILYALIAATPLLGWWLSSASGFPLKYLSLVPLPDLAPKNQKVAELLGPIHAASAWTLIALVVLHVLAALKHHWIDRDDVLRRMIWSRSNPSVKPRSNHAPHDRFIRSDGSHHLIVNRRPGHNGRSGRLRQQSGEIRRHSV